jgi:hypothetical protein
VPAAHQHHTQASHINRRNNNASKLVASEGYDASRLCCLRCFVDDNQPARQHTFRTQHALPTARAGSSLYSEPQPDPTGPNATHSNMLNLYSNHRQPSYRHSASQARYCTDQQTSHSQVAQQLVASASTCCAHHMRFRKHQLARLPTQRLCLAPLAPSISLQAF